jgi:hypothetical protein
MVKSTDVLATLCSQFVARRPEWSCDWFRECSQKIVRLAEQGIVTVDDLVSRLPDLSTAKQQLGLHLVSVLAIRQAVPVLLEMLPNRANRATCAAALGSIKAGKIQPSRGGRP